MINRLFLAVLLLSALSLFSASGQKSLERDQPERILEEGLFHYERGYYGVARELFGKARDAAPAGQAALKADAAFYEALSASYLENGDAPFLLERYLEDYPESKHLSHTNFRLGELAQDDNRDRIALRWFEKVKPADLDREVRLRYFYKAGYAYFMEDDYVNASRLLPITTMPIFSTKRAIMRRLCALLKNCRMSRVSNR
jgi:tetratricopeptide (TPR) repeat protein